MALANFGLPKFKTDADQDIFDKLKPRERVAVAIQFAEHAAAEAECYAFGAAVAKACGCRFIKADLKSLSRANDKVVKDYEGHGWSKMKDLVRMTILAETPGQLKLVGRTLRGMVTPPWAILKDEEAKAETDACGYSGLNFALQKNRAGSVGMVKLGQAAAALAPDARGISNAQWAKTVRMEIQANVPEIIYGKENAETFVGMLGEYGADLHQKMKGKYKIVGGLGHAIYEVSTKGVPSQVQTDAKALSKRYYAYLRNRLMLTPTEFDKLCGDLTDLIGNAQAFFAKHPVASVSLFAKRVKLPIPAIFGK